VAYFFGPPFRSKVTIERLIAVHLRASSWLICIATMLNTVHFGQQKPFFYGERCKLLRVLARWRFVRFNRGWPAFPGDSIVLFCGIQQTVTRQSGMRDVLRHWRTVRTAIEPHRTVSHARWADTDEFRDTLPPHRRPQFTKLY